MSANDYYNKSGGYYPPQSGTLHVTQAQYSKPGLGCSNLDLELHRRLY